jgi:hypothetical protein
LNPLIERALSLSWFAVRRSIWRRASVAHRRLHDQKRPFTAARAATPSIIC